VSSSQTCSPRAAISTSISPDVDAQLLAQLRHDHRASVGPGTGQKKWPHPRLPQMATICRRSNAATPAYPQK
jgi:hypothetical protein